MSAFSYIYHIDSQIKEDVVLKILLTLLVSVLPIMAHAHPGHDHAHWTSALIHSLPTIGMFVLIGTCLVLAISYPFGKKQEKK